LYIENVVPIHSINLRSAKGLRRRRRHSYSTGLKQLAIVGAMLGFLALGA
jgi:hypothetical protein